MVELARSPVEIPAAAPHKKVVAAIPAFNEEKYIGTIVLQTRQYVDEVLVVDDGSSDHTAEVARLAGAIVIRHAANQGVGAAYQSLLSAAKRRGADILVFLDADTQHNPAEIPRLVKAVCEGFDLVVGSREEQADRIPRYRRVGQKVLLYSTKVLSGARVADSECGFRAFSRKAILEINLNENGFAVESEIVGQATLKGLKVTEVPVSTIYTKDGSTLNPLVHGLGVLSRIIVLVSEWRPLFFFGLGGAVLELIGLILGIKISNQSLRGEGLAVGTALIAAILIIVGLLSIFTAIILNALKRVRFSARN